MKKVILSLVMGSLLISPHAQADWHTWVDSVFRSMSDNKPVVYTIFGLAVFGGGILCYQAGQRNALVVPSKNKDSASVDHTSCEESIIKLNRQIDTRESENIDLKRRLGKVEKDLANERKDTFEERCNLNALIRESNKKNQQLVGMLRSYASFVEAFAPAVRVFFKPNRLDECLMDQDRRRLDLMNACDCVSLRTEGGCMGGEEKCGSDNASNHAHFSFLRENFESQLEKLSSTSVN
ncbi:MAG: hypothetical protein WC707_04265 [Candidatus Babeliaceae bacterium]